LSLLRPAVVTKGAVPTASGEVVLQQLPKLIKFQGTHFVLMLGMKGLGRMGRIAQEPT
jgi:hypothetical protein